MFSSVFRYDVMCERCTYFMVLIDVVFHVHVRSACVTFPFDNCSCKSLYADFLLSSKLQFNFSTWQRRSVSVVLLLLIIELLEHDFAFLCPL